MNGPPAAQPTWLGRPGVRTRDNSGREAFRLEPPRRTAGAEARERAVARDALGAGFGMSAISQRRRTLMCGASAEYARRIRPAARTMNSKGAGS